MKTTQQLTRSIAILVILGTLVGTAQPSRPAWAARMGQDGTEGWGAFTLPAPTTVHIDLPQLGATSESQQRLTADAPAAGAEQPAERVQLAAADLTVYYNHPLGSGAPSFSPNSPTAANQGQMIWAAYNKYVAVSADYGSTWLEFDPTLIINFTPNDGFHNGLSGHQEIRFEPSRGLMFWLVPSVEDADGNNLQLGVSTDAGSNWYFFQILPDGFCSGGVGSVGDWFKEPRLALTGNYLYILSDVFRKPGDTDHCSAILRLSLDELAAGFVNLGSFYYSTTNFNFAAADGGTDKLYFSSHVDGDTLRIYQWPESVPVPTSDVKDHTAYVTPTSYVCNVGLTGVNPCATLDDRITAGWLRTDLNQLGFMWTAPQDGTHPFPYIQTVVMDASTLNVVQNSFATDSGKALFLPSAGVNLRGHVGGTFATAGGTSTPEYPQCSVWLYDDIVGSIFSLGTTAVVTSGNSNPATNDWGHYFSSHKNDVNPKQWLGTCYAMQSGAAVPRVVRFGRERDATSISGNAGVAGAVLAYNDGGPKTVVADGGGNYAFPVSSGWSGTVTVSLPHYFFTPTSRTYVAVVTDQPAQDYAAHPYVVFKPDDGATVCRTPYIIVKLTLSNLTRTASGLFNLATVTFNLDGGSVLNLASIRVPQASPNVWVHFMYQPTTPLSQGPHTAAFTHPEAVFGTVTDTWTFTAADITCTQPTLLSALAGEQTVELLAASEQPSTSDGTRRSLVDSLGPSVATSNTDSQQPAQAPSASPAAERDWDPQQPAAPAPQAGALAPAPAPDGSTSPQPAQPLILPAFDATEIAVSAWLIETGRPALIYLKAR